MSKNTLAAKLAANEIFAWLSADDLTQLAQIASPHRYDRDEWVVLYSEPWPYLFWVESGLITALKESPEGRSLIIATIKPGEVFWGTAFFDEESPMPVALVATQSSKIHLWSRERLLPLLLRNGRMSWELSRLLVARMQHASQMVEELAFRPITGRLAHLLLERYGKEKGQPVARDLTLDEMAARIGSTREMVCRALYRFSDDGLIEITRTEFLFTNPDKLEELARKGKRSA